MTLKSTLILSILILLVASIIILYIRGNKSVHAEIIIQAEESYVWSALTNLDSVRKWNSILVPIEGELKEGGAIKYTFYEEGKDPAVMSAKVVTIQENRLINQRGGIVGILTFNHRYELEPIYGATKVTIHETYKGIGVNFWNPSSVQVAYEKLLLQLKNEVSKKDI